VRTEFHRQLHALNADLARLCESAGDAIGCATLALLTVDLDAAKGVLTELEILARLRLEVDRTALAVLARHAPVASYLRMSWAPTTSALMQMEGRTRRSWRPHRSSTLSSRRPSPRSGWLVLRNGQSRRRFGRGRGRGHPRGIPGAGQAGSAMTTRR